MEFKIREAVSTDKPQILELINSLKQFESQFDESYKTDFQSVTDLYNNVNSNATVFVAETENKVIAFISLEIENKNDELIEEKIPVAYISDIVVLPEYRSHGIGKKLLETAENWAKNKNYPFLKLIVFSNNNIAKKLYSDFGFKEYETTMLKNLLD